MRCRANFGDSSISIGPYPCNHHCIYFFFPVNTVSGYQSVVIIVTKVSLTVLPSMGFIDQEFCVESDRS